MSSTTLPADREALARKHRQRGHQGLERFRQRLRLTLLRAWGVRYRRPQLPAEIRPSGRILLLRPDHLGDLLFATPALRLLRNRFPQSHIAALVGPWGEAVLAGNPDLDEVHLCPFPGFSRQAQGNPLAPYKLLAAEARRLQALQFDLALILRFDHWWGAWLAAAAAIPRRIGYAIPEVAPFLTQAVPYLPGRHEVLQNVGLVMAAGGEGAWARRSEEEGWRLRFELSEADVAAAARLLVAAGAAVEDERRVVAIHPGSGAAVKRWRTEAWSELAARLIHGRGVQIVFTGSAGEAELIQPILQALPVNLNPQPVSLAGQTELGVLAALYRRCALVIGPDSGPLHLAVAVGAPTIHLYGPVDARTFGPWGNPSRQRVITSNWSCIPCNRLDWPEKSRHEHGCLADIRVEAVLTEALDLLSRASDDLLPDTFPMSF